MHRSPGAGGLRFGTIEAMSQLRLGLSWTSRLGMRRFFQKHRRPAAVTESDKRMPSGISWRMPPSFGTICLAHTGLVHGDRGPTAMPAPFRVRIYSANGLSRACIAFDDPGIGAIDILRQAASLADDTVVLIRGYTSFSQRTISRLTVRCPRSSPERGEHGDRRSAFAAPMIQEDAREPIRPSFICIVKLPSPRRRKPGRAPNPWDFRRLFWCDFFPDKRDVTCGFFATGLKKVTTET